MALRYLLTLSAGLLLTIVAPTPNCHAGDYLFGCCTRPACGKVCQLVCEKKKLAAVCYGYECKDICIPCPSQCGCKHCEACCGECECSANSCCCPTCQPAGPVCKFCWRDWFACGCAQPRTVKVLTKYQAEKKIDWYHWEVVDAGCCEGVSCGEAIGANANSPAAGRLGVYKAAPPESNVGDTFEVNDDERSKLAQWTGAPLLSDLAAPSANDEQPESHAEQSALAVQQASASEPADSTPSWGKLSRWFRLGN